MKETYLITENYRGPKVIFDPSGHNRPPKIIYKVFRKGEQINGVMRYKNGQPLVVMTSGNIPVPIKYVKRVVAKDITSSASGPVKSETPKVEMPVIKSGNSKIMYIDAMMLGAILGALAVHFAEKKGYIESVSPKNKLYGAAGGAFLGWYLIYRNNQTSNSSTIKIIKP